MRWIRAIGCLLLAAVLWVAVLRVGFGASATSLTGALAKRQLALWQGRPDASLGVLRRTNPEWDLMARLFAVLAFAELAERGSDTRYRQAIDGILARTEAELAGSNGLRFLLPYGHGRPFVDSAQRSLFVDGEVALMMARRALLSPTAAHLAAARPWIDRIVGQLERAPHVVAESYPDEAWIFCNTVALAAIRLFDLADNAPLRHQALIARWLAGAKDKLIEPKTGLLVSETSYAGAHHDGPEGSTLWLATTMLLLLDEDFAKDQYKRARAELRGAIAGFGWAREWPRSQRGADDVDSGPTIPIIGANAGSSGLALVAARAFGDRAFEQELVASLGLGGFPIDGGERFAAGNQLADAVILWASVLDPSWAHPRGGQR